MSTNSSINEQLRESKRLRKIEASPVKEPQRKPRIKPKNKEITINIKTAGPSGAKKSKSFGGYRGAEIRNSPGTEPDSESGTSSGENDVFEEIKLVSQTNKQISAKPRLSFTQEKSEEEPPENNLDSSEKDNFSDTEEEIPNIAAPLIHEKMPKYYQTQLAKQDLS